MMNAELCLLRKLLPPQLGQKKMGLSWAGENYVLPHRGSPVPPLAVTTTIAFHIFCAQSFQHDRRRGNDNIWRMKWLQQITDCVWHVWLEAKPISSSLHLMPLDSISRDSSRGKCSPCCCCCRLHCVKKERKELQVTFSTCEGGKKKRLTF